MRTLRATRNEHNWTCTVPWHVFPLCVKTLQMTMTMIHEGETMTQMSGKQATHAPRVKALCTATSAAAINRPFSLKCRDVLRHLDHVKSGSTAHDGCAKNSQNKLKSLRRDPIMLCCDQCEWYCAVCCWNSERQTSMNRKKKTLTHPYAGTPRHPHTHTDTHTCARTRGFKFGLSR